MGVLQNDFLEGMTANLGLRDAQTRSPVRGFLPEETPLEPVCRSSRDVVENLAESRIPSVSTVNRGLKSRRRGAGRSRLLTRPARPKPRRACRPLEKWRLVKGARR